jgi:hypothetical protein
MAAASRFRQLPDVPSMVAWRDGTRDVPPEHALVKPEDELSLFSRSLPRRKVPAHSSCRSPIFHSARRRAGPME